MVRDFDVLFLILIVLVVFFILFVLVEVWDLCVVEVVGLGLENLFVFYGFLLSLEDSKSVVVVSFW